MIFLKILALAGILVLLIFNFLFWLIAVTRKEYLEVVLQIIITFVIGMLICLVVWGGAR